MITFLFGDEGHGKSTYIIEKIKEDTKNRVRSFLIVPEQQTVISEKEIASLLPPSAQLYCEAINFTRLANKLFREYGGLRYNYISNSGKSLAMYRAICLCRDFLKEYKIQKGHEKSCIKLFLGAIGELKAYSISQERLSLAIQEIENPHFKGKLEDISLIWSTFDKIISESYDDPLDDILMLESKLRQHNYFKGTNVYIDSFYSFTSSQLKVIEHIFEQADNVTIALDCPFNCLLGKMQYAKITDARDRLFSICRQLNKKYEAIAFDTDYKHTSKGIGLLCDKVWDFSSDTVYAEGIELIQAEDEFAECEYVASKIKELIMSGAKYSDIAVIMRNSATYKGIIDYSFDKYDIPYFYSTSTSIVSMPVIKMVFSALNAISAYRYEDIIAYIKCGYTHIDENQLNDFESYMFRWNIYGKKFKNEEYWAANPDGYVEKPTITQLETLASVNNVRDEIIKKLEILESAFIKNSSVKDICKAVFQFLSAHNIRAQLQGEIDSCDSRQDAYELSQVWNLLISSLDTLVSICGESIVSVDEFITLLKYALEDNKIGTIPSSEDNVVIGDAPTIRIKNIKHSFILGVNEGCFPAEISDEGFFTDTDKITLETYGIDLSSKTDIRSDDELLAFRNALSLASDTVTVSCLKSNIKGSNMQPSIAFLRLRSLLGEDYKIKDTSSILPIDKIYNPRVAKEFVGGNPDLMQAIKELYPLENLPQGDFSNENLSISDKTANELFGNHIYLSKTSIESFASCKLKYYCDYILKLKPSKKITFASNHIGTLNHLIIERFFTMQRDEGFDASSLTDDEIENIIDDTINYYALLVCGSKSVSSKLRHLFDRLKRSLVVYIREIINEFKQSEFNSEFFELSLTGDGDSAPKSLVFKIGEGATASLVGTADRVDIYRKDGVTYVKVIDYKSGSEKISREFISQGFGLQLFIYLFTLCKISDGEFKDKLLAGTSEIKPAGIMYFPMNISKKNVDYDVDLDSKELSKIEKSTISERIERSGFFLDNITVLEAQDKDLQGKYIPDRSKHRDSYLSLEDFEDIYKELQLAIDKIGTEILSGSASSEPVKITSKHDPCIYCEHASVCRRRSK